MKKIYIFYIMMSIFFISCGQVAFDPLTPPLENQPLVINSEIYIEEDDPLIKYSGNWNIQKNTNANNNFIRVSTLDINDKDISNIKKNNINFKFKQTGIKYLATKNNKQIPVEIYLDKIFQGTFNLYSENTLDQQVIFSKDNLENKEHTIEIIPSIEIDPNSIANEINIDAFVFPNIRKSQQCLKVFPNGDYIISWVDMIADKDSYSGDSIYMQIFDNKGNKKSPQIKVSSGKEEFDYSIDSPQIIINKENEFRIIWRKIISRRGLFESDKYEFYTKVFNNIGESISQESKLVYNIDYSKSGFDLSLAEKISDDTFLIIFSRDSDLFARIYRSNNSNYELLHDEIRINDYMLGTQYSPSISRNSNGEFVVVWNSSDYGNSNNNQDGSFGGIIAKRFNENFYPLTPDIIVNDEKNDNQQNPSVAMDDDGNFIVTWETDSRLDDFPYQPIKNIYARAFNKKNEPITKDILVNTTIMGEQKNPKLVLDSNQNALIAWLSEKNRDKIFEPKLINIYGQAINMRGVKIGKEFQLTNENNAFRDNIQLKLLNNKIYISWENDKSMIKDYIKTDIYHNIFDIGQIIKY